MCNKETRSYCTVNFLPPKWTTESKARSKDYAMSNSRSTRIKRKLKGNAIFCNKITEYFPLLNKLDLLTKENYNLKQRLNNRFGLEISNDPSKTDSNFFFDLLTSLQTNIKHSEGNRYDNSLKLLSSYLFIVGGPYLYKTLQQNLPIPSISTIKNTIKDTGTYITEGEVRIAELVTFLEINSYPKEIWISEDATEVISRLQYDSSSNQIIGFTLPLNDNGLPKIFEYPASSAKEIESYFKSSPRSYLIYVIMAQPSKIGASPFCLSIFGTNNKFTASNIISRWRFITKECETAGIRVLGFSGDGDPRILKAMKNELYLTSEPQKETLGKRQGNSYPSNWDWFLSEFSKINYVQDTVHIGTKFRTRFLKSDSVHLQMGDYKVSIKHLYYLIDKFSKDKHFLTKDYLSPTDKMNFKAVEKIRNKKVTDLLHKELISGKATVLYLKMIKKSLDAFLNPELKPIERIDLIWSVIFFMRIWRSWVLKSKHYKMKNFITSNLYHCLEINAHSLINLIRQFKLENKAHLFLPTLFSSQPCESFFRAIRSMTSTFSTVVNFSVLEILYRLKRIELCEKIKHDDKFKNYNFVKSARAWQNRGQNSSNIYDLPSDEEINKVVIQAKEKALREASNLNMTADCMPHIQLVKNILEETEDLNDEDDPLVNALYENRNLEESEEESEIYQNHPEEDMEEITSLKEIDRDELSFEKDVPEDGNFIAIKIKGKRHLIKKTTLCWLLQDSDKKLSSDRKYRVMNK